MLDDSLDDGLIVKERRIVRPVAITVICAIGTLSALSAIVIGLVPNLHIIPGHEMNWIFIFAGLVSFVLIYGLWKMKRWAGITYIVLSAIQLLLFIVAGTDNIIGLLFALAMLITIAVYLKDMN